MDDYRDSELFKRLVRQGLGGGSVGAENPHGIKAPASSREALSGEVVADARGGLTHRPTAGGEPADLGMGNGRAVNAPTKFTGLHIVSDNSRCLTMAKPLHGAPRDVMVKHLVLVWSEGHLTLAKSR